MKRDSSAERIVISAILQYGADALYEVDSILSENDFSLSINKEIYAIIKNLAIDNKVEQFDLTTVCTVYKNTFGEDEYVSNKINQYVDALINSSLIDKDNLTFFAKKIVKQSVIEQLSKRLLLANQNLSKLTGEEDINDILLEADKPISEFNNSLLSANDYELIGSDILEFIQHLKENQGTSPGIPSGFPKWDRAIGGGLVSPGVHVVGARAKAGKSFMGLNIAWHVTGLEMPVLFLDTELNKTMTQSRLLARVSQVDVDKIRNGNFSDFEHDEQRVLRAGQEIANRPYYYENISGLHYTRWMSIVKKWIKKDVGFTDGKVNPCLVILDYIKMMDMGDLKNGIQEYQYLGQLITDFHNLCIQYNIPALAFVQLNRDGISQDGQGVIAGSDRIIALCSSFSILRKKEEADYAADSAINGNRKLTVIETRFGQGLNPSDYINLKTNLAISSMIEGPTRHEVERTSQNQDESPPFDQD